MSLKAELQTWANALAAYEKQDFNSALGLFEHIADTSRIFFNLGLIHATLGGHEQAVAYFDQAVNLDPFFAVAFFQSGVSQFLLGRYAEAKRDFDDAYLYLRGNDLIDYEQLGLKFKLFLCEILFNRGLASIYLGQYGEGMQDLVAAQRKKRSPEHDVIDEACTDRGEGYTVFSVPVGVLFRPAQTKLENLETKDYLGQAKVVAASDANDLFIGFSGTRKLEAFAGSSRSGSSLSKTRRNAHNRSKTSAARLEGSVDGMAGPFRPRGSPVTSDRGTQRSQTADAALQTSASTLVAPSPRENASPARLQLPTPPPSDEQHAASVPARPPRPAAEPFQLSGAPSNVRKPLGIASSRDDIDEYYSHPVLPLDIPRSSSPTAILPASSSRSLLRLTDLPRLASSGFTPLAPLSSQPSTAHPLELDRVANGQHRPARPSNPQPRSGSASASGSDSSFLCRDNSGSSTTSRRQGVQVTFAPHSTAPPGPGQVGRQGRLAVASALNGDAGVGGHPGLLRDPSARGGPAGRNQRPPLAEQKSTLDAVGEGMLGLSLHGNETGGVGGGGGSVLTAEEVVGLVRSASQASWGGGTIRDREEMVKVRVKLRFKGDVRGMSILADFSLATFLERVHAKFDCKTKLSVKFKDWEGALVSVLDVDDWESAMDQAREAADGRPEGKLEIFLGED
ncbi:hypothetical protein JCM11251_002044 [Rhodosporidiobolus azoricus]